MASLIGSSPELLFKITIWRFPILNNRNLSLFGNHMEHIENRNIPTPNSSPREKPGALGVRAASLLSPRCPTSLVV